MRSVVITGTSTGIGWGTAKVLANNGFRVFGSLRRRVDAERIAAELGPRFVPLLFDVTDAAAANKAASEVRNILDGETLAGLVNNAGVAVPSLLLSLPIEDFRRQIDTNLTGAVIAIQAFAPLLGADPNLKGRPGRIINISSISGGIGSPFLTAYTASKFAIEGLSESLRRELLPFGIDVIVIVPGMVATPIWEKAGKFEAAYVGTAYEAASHRLRAYIEYGKRGMSPERIGQSVMHALTAARPRPRYKIGPFAAMHRLARLLPERCIDRVFGKVLGL